MAQWVKRPLLILAQVMLRVLKSSPKRFHTQEEACIGFSLSISLCSSLLIPQPCTHALSLALWFSFKKQTKKCFAFFNMIWIFPKWMQMFFLTDLCQIVKRYIVACMHKNNIQTFGMPYIIIRFGATCRLLSTEHNSQEYDSSWFLDKKLFIFLQLCPIYACFCFYILLVSI